MKIRIGLNFKFILTILFIIILNGCGFKNLIFPDDLGKYSTWESRLLEPYQICFGMSKKEIVTRYGKPRDIDYDAKYFTGEFDSIKGKWEYEPVDERWGYEYHTGIKYVYGNLWWIYFYFKDNKVVKVDTK